MSSFSFLHNSWTSLINDMVIDNANYLQRFICSILMRASLVFFLLLLMCSLKSLHFCDFFFFANSFELRDCFLVFVHRNTATLSVWTLGLTTGG